MFRYPFQSADRIDTYSDTDWAGCLRTRKSTSGGCILRGKHLLKSWSKSHGLVALSSGESELYAVVKASAEGIGLVLFVGWNGRPEEEYQSQLDFLNSLHGR